MQRSDNPDYWQSVTGGLKHDELPQQAAQREVQEETGIVGTPVDRQQQNVFEIKGVWRKRYDPSDTHNTEHVFTLAVESPLTVRLNQREHLNFKWVSADHAVTQTASDTNRQAIKQWVVPLLS